MCGTPAGTATEAWPQSDILSEMLAVIALSATGTVPTLGGLEVTGKLMMHGAGGTQLSSEAGSSLALFKLETVESSSFSCTPVSVTQLSYQL